MSGGSFNYLYCKDPAELFDCAIDIDDMTETLIKLNYLDVAKDMTRLAEYIKTARNRVEVLSEQLKPIMKAVEYYVSCDYSEENVKEAVEKYRNDEHFNKCHNCGAKIEIMQPIGCINCKHGDKKNSEEPCIHCDEKYSKWEAEE